MDVFFFRYINQFAGRWPTLDAVGRFCASDLIWLMGFSLIILFALRSHVWEKRHELAIIIAAGVSGVMVLVVNYLISLVYFRLRPFAAFTDVHQLIIKSAAEKSFPSDHASLAFALATVVFCSDRRMGTVFMVLAILIALGRVFVGVHYPMDVLVGAVFGIGTGFVTWRLGRRTFLRCVSPRKHHLV